MAKLFHICAVVWCFSVQLYAYFGFCITNQVTGDVVNIVLDDLTPSVTAKTVSYHAVKKQELLYQLHSIVLHRKIKARIEKTAFYKREMKRMEAVMQTQEVSILKQLVHC